MRRVQVAITIRVPRERVWALYDDMASTPAWVPFVEEVLETSGPPGVGMVYRERTRLGGVTGVQAWRIVEYEPPSRRVETSDSLRMHSRLIITLDTVLGYATRLTQVTELRSTLPMPLGWLHERITGFVARRAMRAAITGAKHHAEAAPG